jgi:glutathione S-transferase
MAGALLYFLPGAGSFAPHVLLEATGMEHELVRVERDDDGRPVEPKAYLALNPSGRIPTLIWPDGTVQTESAAISLAIAERTGRHDLAPAPDNPQRPAFLSRLVFLTNTVQVAILRARYPQRFADGDEARAAVVAHASGELAVLRARCAGWYDGAAFCRGDDPGVDDIFLGMLIRWTRLTAEPWWDEPVLGAFYDRFHALDAVTAAREHEGFEVRPPAGT